VITGLIAQHVPARADRCPGWLDEQMDRRRSIRSVRQKSVWSRGSPDITPPLEYGVPAYEADGPVVPPEGQRVEDSQGDPAGALG
jgi:hypothetical protein